MGSWQYGTEKTRMVGNWHSGSAKNSPAAPLSNSVMLMQMEREEQASVPMLMPVVQMFDERGMIADTKDQRVEHIVKKIPLHTLHHVVPVDAITKNWNEWLKDPMVWRVQMTKVCDQFDVLLANDDRGHMEINQADVDAVRKLIFQVLVNLEAGIPPFTHIDGNVTSKALGMMQWMPANFVVGALHREHDPGSNLDLEAANTQDEYIAMAATYKARTDSIKFDMKETDEQRQAKVSREMFAFYDTELDMADKKLSPEERLYGNQRTAMAVILQFESAYRSIQTQYGGVAAAAKDCHENVLDKIKKVDAETMDAAGLEGYDETKLAIIKGIAAELEEAALAVDAYVLGARRAQEQIDIIDGFPKLAEAGRGELSRLGELGIPEAAQYSALIEVLLKHFASTPADTLKCEEINGFSDNYTQMRDMLVELKTVNSTTASSSGETASDDLYGGFDSMFDQPEVTEREDVAELLAILPRIVNGTTFDLALTQVTMDKNALPESAKLRTALETNIGKIKTSVKRAVGFRYLNEDNPDDLE